MPAPRVCTETGCPTLVPKAGRCPSCAAAYERRRGTSGQRGYGYTHQKRRAADLAAAKPTDLCPRCHQPLGTVDPDLLHEDHTDDRRGYLGLSHADCNLSAGGRAAHAGA